MRKEIKVFVLVLLALRVILWLTGCAGREKHEAEVVPNLVRVYDVEMLDGDSLEEYPGVELNYHEYRMGIFTGISEGLQAPFRAGCNSVKIQTGIDVEYIIMDSWEALREELEETKGDGATKIVLFNNTYDQSVIKELRSGQYVDMENALDEIGLYNEELYDQAVMAGGRVDGMQLAVPLLYNVSGMVQGEKNTELFIDAEILSREDYDPKSLSYEDFIGKLNAAMDDWEEGSMDMPFLSAGFYENDLDLFLLASGMDWAGYEDQKELFELLLEYRKMYQETQMDTQERGLSNQQLHMMYLKSNERLGYDEACTPGTIEDLRIEFPDPSYTEHNAIMNITMAEAYLTRSKYMVECSAAEDIAFHSILGTLNYSRTYATSFYEAENMIDLREIGRMDYYPIGIEGDSEAYAAQLVCYAAVAEGGDEALAATVLSGLLNYKTLGIYGLSPCIEIRDWQVENWLQETYYLGMVRTIKKMGNGTYTIPTEQAFWNNITGTNAGPMARDIAAEQLREQLTKVVTAEIPDREALTIWQDTLTEAVDSELSAEAGFELLCERMDEWYTE